MSLLTELFGPEILLATLEEVKQQILNLPETIKEKKTILLNEYAQIKNITLIGQDFDDIMSNA